jgi:acetyltransferase
VALARCVRDPDDPERAEFAIAVLDTWQRRGVGTLLARCLARRARAVGIRRWLILFLSENTAARGLLDRIATKQSEWYDSPGVIAAVYDLTAS